MSIKEIIKLTLPVNSNQNLIQRPSTAPITLLEYGDYQCPYCARANPIIRQVQKQLSNKLQFVFRNFPITQIHPQAQHEAEAAEFAAAQNKFWDMHDHLYEHHQQALDDNHLGKYEQPYWRELL
jgi:protein-disulfide isomerase